MTQRKEIGMPSPQQLAALLGAGWSHPDDDGYSKDGVSGRRYFWSRALKILARDAERGDL